MAQKITVFDAAGGELATEDSKSKAARFSVRGAADQRQLNALIARHPDAVSGAIGSARFTILNSRESRFSHFQGETPPPAARA